MVSEWDKDHTEKCVFIQVSRNEILVAQMIVADYIILVKRPVFASYVDHKCLCWFIQALVFVVNVIGSELL